VQQFSVDGDLGGLLLARRVPDSVRTFLRLMLTSSGTPLLVSESAAAWPTAAHRVRFAEGVIGCWQASGKKQPYKPYVDEVHAAALDSCTLLQKFGAVPTAMAWASRLGPSCDKTSLPITTSAEWTQFVAQLVDIVLSSTVTATAVLQQCAFEVAAVLVERQQSPRLAINHLVRSLQRKRNAAVDIRTLIVDSLLPAARPHVALLGVTGTKELARLGSSSPGVGLRQIEPDARHQFRGWGNAGGRGQTFGRGLAAGTIETGEGRLRSTAPHVLVSVELKAVDTNAALVQARAALSEALDRYVAAHPAVRLAIEPVAAVADPTSHASFCIDDARGFPMPDLTPLDVPWPPQLLIALRMANLMRGSAAPITRAALCWVTLESAGLEAKPTSRTTLGKALALATVRQLHLRAYRNLVADCGANSERRHRHLRRAHNLRGRARRLLRVDPRIKGADRLHLAGLRWSATSVMHERLAVLADRNAADKRKLLHELGVAMTTDEATPSARLVAFQQWARLLRLRAAAVAMTPPERAFRALLADMEPHDLLLLDEMAYVDGDPSAAANVLTRASASYGYLVSSLYVCRNLHLHSGVHDLDGSVTLGAIGPMMVDASFEIWSAWYGAGSTLTPSQVLEKLEQRFDECIAKLAAGTLVEDLDLAQLTGPDWSPGRGP
jgi:hypothetical protein